MASTVIDNLVVNLGLNSSEFAAGIKSVEGALEKVNSAVKAIGASLAVVFVKNQLTKFADMAQHLDTLSKKTGISTKEIQDWGNAVQIEGGSAEAFEGTLQHLSDEMQNITVTGTSGMVPMLAKLGISYRNVGGSMKTPIQLLRDLSVKFQGLSNQQAFSLGKKLGLDDGTIALLQKGSKGIDEILKKTSKLAVLNEKDIKRGIQLRKSWQELSLVFKKLGMMIGSAFLPIANKLTSWALKLSEWCNNNGENVKHIFEALAIIWGVNIAQKAIPSLMKALSLLFSHPLFSVGLATLVALFDDLRTFMEGGDSMFNWQPVLDGFQEFINSPLWEKLKGLFSSIWELIKSLVSMFVSLFDLLSDLGVFKALGVALGVVADALGLIVDGLKWIVDKGAGVMKWIGNLFGGKKEEAEPVKNANLSDANVKALQKLEKETTPTIPLTAANNNNVNNSQTSTSIGNITINTSGDVDSESIKKIANTTTKSTPSQLAVQSNYGM